MQAYKEIQLIYDTLVNIKICQRNDQWNKMKMYIVGAISAA